MERKAPLLPSAWFGDWTKNSEIILALSSVCGRRGEGEKGEKGGDNSRKETKSKGASPNYSLLIQAVSEVIYKLQMTGREEAPVVSIGFRV